MTQEETTHLRCAPVRQAGFSLIELVGVLAVMAIIAAAVVPTFVRRLDFEAKKAEQENLTLMADALKQAALRARAIPGSADFTSTIASNLAFNANQITHNPRGFARWFLVHPGARINGGTAGNLAYVQSSTGATTPPENARVLIVSVVAKALPTTLSLTATDFDEIWNAAQDTIPTPLSSWGGRAEDLVIGRVDFGPLFHRVVLNNVDPYPRIGRYAINTNSVAWDNTRPYVLNNTRSEAYYLDGTVLHLYMANGNPDVREIVRADTGFLYQHDRWSRRLTGSDDTGPFGQLVLEFLKPPAPPDPAFAATQQAVINAFFSYLWGFAIWAVGDPSTVHTASGTAITPAVPPFYGNNDNYPMYSLAEDARAELDRITQNLIR